jgi:hypothetical protein
VLRLRWILSLFFLELVLRIVVLTALFKRPGRG